MSLKEYREQLLNRLLTFLWRQWSALGLLGESGGEEDWVIDPESLLVFSLEIGRYEPRLFDEILAWLKVNGQWLDTPRLRNIIEAAEPISQSLWAAFCNICWITAAMRANGRTW